MICDSIATNTPKGNQKTGLVGIDTPDTSSKNNTHNTAIQVITMTAARLFKIFRNNGVLFIDTSEDSEYDDRKEREIPL
jgi:hypothetical protein